MYVLTDVTMAGRSKGGCVEAREAPTGTQALDQTPSDCSYHQQNQSVGLAGLYMFRVCCVDSQSAGPDYQLNVRVGQGDGGSAAKTQELEAMHVRKIFFSPPTKCPPFLVTGSRQQLLHTPLDMSCTWMISSHTPNAARIIGVYRACEARHKCDRPY